MSYHAIDRQSPVTITTGNSKIGAAANLSFPPVVTCNKCAGCAKGGCYALKAWRQYKTARDAWRGNLAAWKTDPARFFAEVRRQLSTHNPRWFRWFVAGDFPSRAFISAVFAIAREFPNIRFLVFTKRYGWVNQTLSRQSRPSNLSIILSAWPGLPLNNPHGLPVAWMRDDKSPDPRIPANAMPCIGNCETCGLCWSIASTGRDVVFEKH